MDTNLHPAAGVIVKSDQAVSISVSHNFSFEIGNSRENSPKEPSSVHTPCPEKTEAQSTASTKLIFSVSRSLCVSRSLEALGLMRLNSAIHEFENTKWSARRCPNRMTQPGHDRFVTR
jgi:hypothetical protein